MCLLKDPVLEIEFIGQDIGLTAEGQMLALITLLAVPKAVPNTALYIFPGGN